MSRKPARNAKHVSKKRENNPSRKKASTNKSIINIRKVRPILSGVLVFAFSLLALFSYSFYKKLTTPFASASSSSAYDITQNDIFTILFVSVNSFSEKTPVISKLEVGLYDNKSMELRMLSLDITSQVDVPGKYGNEGLYKVLALGSSVGKDGIDSGILLLNETVKKELGFKIDKFVVVEDSKYNETINTLKYGGIENLFNLFTHSRDVVTNLGLNEIYFITNIASKYTFDSTLSSKTINASSEQVTSIIRDATFDSLVAEERKSIAVLNGTNVSGVATYGAHAIENMGGRVIAVENSKESYEESLLIVDSFDSATVKEIQKYFGVTKILLKENSREVLDDAVSRADITIIIGFDIVNAL